MKLKTKLFASLFVVLILGVTTSAFAQQTCAITTTPVPREVLNSHWANTGDLIFTCGAVGATATTEASVTVFYSGLLITNTTTVPANHSIGIAPGATLAATLDATRTDTGGTGVSGTGSLVAMTIPAQAAGAPGGTFTLRNVLLSLAGATTAGQSVSVSANVISVSGNVVLTGAPAVIISSVLPYLNTGTNPPSLVTPVTPPTVPATFTTGGNPAVFTAAGANPPASASCATPACQNTRATFNFQVSEDHVDTWRAPGTYYTNANGTTLNGTNVVFTFAGMLPGSIISNCVLSASSGTWTLTGSGIAGSAGTTTLIAEVTLGSGAINATTLDSLTLSCGTGTATPAYSAGVSTGAAATPITVTAGAFPTAGANVPQAAFTTAETGGTPRYASGSTVGPITVINFVGGVSGQTTMLIPWVTASGAAAPPAGTFNTGVTVANTTKDPAAFGTDAQGAAVDTAGNLSFYFFPADGSTSFTVTPTTGFGLQGGVLPAGSTFIGNFSDILKAGNQSGSFSGYVFIVANFTHAHGSAFVYGGGAA